MSEAPPSPVAPAPADAVPHAIGGRPRDLPLAAGPVFRALAERND